MKLYASGPMTGLPNHNREGFAAAAAALRKQGHEVINPAELDHNAGVDLTGSGWEVNDDQYEQFMERDIEHVTDDDVDGIVFIPGWEKSGGAGREGLAALKHGKAMYVWSPVLPDELLTLHPAVFIELATTQRLERDTTTQEA